jgi:hypothetical protein
VGAEFGIAVQPPMTLWMYNFRLHDKTLWLASLFLWLCVVFIVGLAIADIFLVDELVLFVVAIFSPWVQGIFYTC